MVRVAALVTVLVCVVLSEARHEPGHCAFYEECGLNPSLGDALISPFVPCLSYSPARLLRGQHYRLLRRVCPFLDRGEGNTYACCSFKQLQSLEKRLTLAKVVVNRCPSCADNFVHVHCITTCSPDQSQTVQVTKVANVVHQDQTRLAVVAYRAFLSNTFAETAFQSCKNVRIPATGGSAIATMCGEYGAKLCTAQHWYDCQGNSTNGLAPLDIDFRLMKEGDAAGVPEGVIPYNGPALKCNETTATGGPACSCQDCKESCPVIPPPCRNLN